MNLPLVDQWLDLEHGDTMSSPCGDAPVAASASAPFDYEPPSSVSFVGWRRPDLPDGLGVIVGASGTGKSTLLCQFGAAARHDWSERPIADHFASGEDARRWLYAVGLSSVPTWWKPYAVLSTGEKFRADLALTLATGGGVVDEFTSVVDRTVARSVCKSLRRSLDGLPLVVATCHHDVVPWLRPDWIIDLDAGRYCIEPKECLQHDDEVVVEVHEVDRAIWPHFARHHYLSSSLHPFARCYIATLGDHAVAFGAAIPFPHGAINNAWRGSRLVTLPDFQGFGVGPRLADWIAEAHVLAGYRYFARTTHPRLGEYRQRSDSWRPTSSNLKRQKPPAGGGWQRFGVDASRVAYSHEFVRSAA